jgi:hypothetical protein
MVAILLISLAALSPLPSGGAAAAPVHASPQVRPRGVADPRLFVERIYAGYARARDAAPPAPTYAYSERLRRLFNAYDAWASQHDDLVGSLDFDWWINAQDWQIRNVRVSVERASAGRRTIVAHFVNMGRPETLRFRFVGANRRWYLDDVVSGTGSGDDGWTLSVLLAVRDE